MTERKSFPFVEKEKPQPGPALRLALQRLYGEWDKPTTGISAATLISLHGEKHYYHPAVSRWSDEEDRLVSAEEMALKNYQSMFGEDPGPGSIMISTLSPAIEKPEPGQVTTDFLLEHGIKIIRFGHLDQTQAEEPADYRSLGFELAESVGEEDEKQACANLYRLTYNFKDLIEQYPDPWIKIKSRVGKEPLNPFMEAMKLG